MTATSATSGTPAVEGWFTTGAEPALTGSACTTCGTVFFPPTAAGFCRNPGCAGEEFEPRPLSRRGTIWSYTDAQYQPPPPFVPPTDPFEPYALAAVELGQVAHGYGVGDLRVGAEVELVVETQHAGADGDTLIWRWLPLISGQVTELGEEADQ